MWPHNEFVGQLEYVQKKLSEHTRSEWVQIADACEVPFSTLKKIGYGQTPTPRSDTVDKIAAYFLKREAREKRRAESRASAG